MWWFEYAREYIIAGRELTDGSRIFLYYAWVWFVRKRAESIHQSLSGRATPVKRIKAYKQLTFAQAHEKGKLCAWFWSERSGSFWWIYEIKIQGSYRAETHPQAPAAAVPVGHYTNDATALYDAASNQTRKFVRSHNRTHLSTHGILSISEQLRRTRAVMVVLLANWNPPSAQSLPLCHPFTAHAYLICQLNILVPSFT